MEFETGFLNIPGGRQLLGLKIRGVQNTERRPTHFVLLLDTSGSMDMQGRLESVKTCAKYLLNFLTDVDRISIVCFSDSANITVNCQATTLENRMVIEGHINGLRTEGSTNLSAGLLKVREVLGASPVNMKVGLVILTDGFANAGVMDENGLRSIVSLIRQSNPNMSVNCVGYGLDHAGDLLRNLSIEGGGSYNIVTSQEHVGPVFGEILGGLVSCVAQNVEIQYPSDWENYSSYASTATTATTTPNGQNASRRNTLFIGDIYSESEVIILLKRSSGSISTNAPSDATIKGFNCIQVEDISYPLVWNSGNSDNVVQNSYMMYYIRWSLAKILERAAVSASSLGENSENLLSDVNVLEGLLQGSGPMVDLLRSEFTNARTLINSRRHNNNVNTSVFLQRSAYLGTGRGGATQTQTYAQDPAGVHVDSAFPPPPPPFMNAAQRAISVSMSTIIGTPQNPAGVHVDSAFPPPPPPFMNALRAISVSMSTNIGTPRRPRRVSAVRNIP